MSIVEQDSFTRPNQSGFGTASNGHTWSNFGDTVNLVLSILSNQGKTTGSSADSWIILGSNTYTSLDLRVRITTNDLAAGNWSGLTARYTDTNNHYRCYLRGANLYMEKKVGGVVTLLTSAGVNNTINTEQWIRFQLINGTLKGKQWVDGSAEPAPWTITTSDSALASGKVGFFVSPNATTDIALFDSFSADDTIANTVLGNHRFYGKVK